MIALPTAEMILGLYKYSKLGLIIIFADENRLLNNDYKKVARKDETVITQN